MSWNTLRAVTAMEGMSAGVPGDAIVPTLVTVGQADKVTATVTAVMTGRAGRAVGSKVAVLTAVVPAAVAMTGGAGWVTAGAAAVMAMTVREVAVIGTMTTGGATGVGTMTPPVVAGTAMTPPQVLVAGAIVTVAMQVKGASATVTMRPEMVAGVASREIKGHLDPPFGGFFSKIKLNSVQDIYS